MSLVEALSASPRGSIRRLSFFRSRFTSKCGGQLSSSFTRYRCDLSRFPGPAHRSPGAIGCRSTSRLCNTHAFNGFRRFLLPEMRSAHLCSDLRGHSLPKLRLSHAFSRFCRNNAACASVRRGHGSTCMMVSEWRTARAIVGDPLSLSVRPVFYRDSLNQFDNGSFRQRSEPARTVSTRSVSPVPVPGKTFLERRLGNTHVPDIACVTIS